MVAAFDKVKQKTGGSGNDWDRFQRWGLYGIEEQDFIVSLAVVNMIFRGDGKNNVISGDCFHKWLTAKTRNGDVGAEYLTSDTKNRIPPITKVLMNPPFPKKSSDRKAYLFIEQALKQMQNGGILFSVLPYSCMVRGGGYLAWRKRLLKENSLLSVITFPEDLFYPVGVHTVGVFVKKGVPHGDSQRVLWVRALNDGKLKMKGKRLEDSRAKNDYPRIAPLLKRFIHAQDTDVPSIPAFQKSCQIEYADPLLELVPENYLEQSPPSEIEVRRGVEQVIRDAAAYLVRSGKEDEIS